MATQSSRIDFAEAITVRLDKYRCDFRVKAVYRIRNGETGRILTLAEATWIRPGMEESRFPTADIATMMRLADVLGKAGRHSLPVNPDACYGVPKYSKTRGDVGTIA